MITGRQIRAARGLLGWDATVLAEKTGLTRETVSRIETDLVRPHEKSLIKIFRAFDENGVEFTENNGVRQKPHSIENFEGREGFARFYEIINEHLQTHGGDVCVSGVDEKLFAKYRDDPELHRSRMAELVKKHPDLRMRILIEEGDYNFVASNYATYRWQPKESFSPTAFYVFGNCLALISFTHDPAPLVVLIKSAAFAEAYRNSFNLAWMSSKDPKPKGKKK